MQGLRSRSRQDIHNESPFEDTRDYDTIELHDVNQDQLRSHDIETSGSNPETGHVKSSLIKYTMILENTGSVARDHVCKFIKI